MIYQKTVQRAKQIEEEEAAALVADTPLAEREGYFEDMDGATDADGWGDDDVSLWDNDEPAVGGGTYRDDWGDEEANGTNASAKPINTALLDEEAAMQSPGGAWGNTSGR